MIGMKNPRAWQRMLSQRQLDIFNPHPKDIEILDIAHGLAFVARWNGQTVGKHPFSVAQHSVLVEQLFHAQHGDDDPRWSLAALLHDAAEYVIGDMISPVKNALGDEYHDLEIGLMNAIHRRFDLPTELPVRVQKAIKLADRSSAWLEAVGLAGFDPEEADRIFLRPNDASIVHREIQPLSGTQAKLAFLTRFGQLSSRA